MVIPQPRTTLRRVSILATDGVFASTLMQAKDFFHMAGIRYAKQQGLGHEPPFEIHLVSPDGLPVNSFSKVRVPVDGGLDTCDVIILPAFWDDFDALSRRYPQVLEWLRSRHAAGTAICGEATGVFWMAEAGLLDGKEATTYWRFFREFSERFPKVQLNQDKHLSDADNLYCAGGITSACDLYIYMIERYCGAGWLRACRATSSMKYSATTHPDASASADRNCTRTSPCCRSSTGWKSTTPTSFASRTWPASTA